MSSRIFQPKNVSLVAGTSESIWQSPVQCDFRSRWRHHEDAVKEVSYLEEKALLDFWQKTSGGSTTEVTGAPALTTMKRRSRSSDWQLEHPGVQHVTSVTSTQTLNSFCCPQARLLSRQPSPQRWLYCITTDNTQKSQSAAPPSWLAIMDPRVCLSNGV